ncbi:alpha/beta hydrolase [Persicimonas caeni]|uniref:Alpha/beta hydrolase n=1 Tax=Persicimonas caeni TaxID=2292766 RepID=A0A4Y6PQ70_PERCE|nr:alpha/beta hydrolase [Persicimonas caeni]QDG50353.1 alpha/beta hydrolase [Persicimonas caeni]QED31574.1 alpha/beta hydrolase [Persicimonas caeni]
METRTYHNNRTTLAGDGTSLAWRSEGDGPAIVFVNGFATSNSYWLYLIERFRRRGQLVTWDLKGHGRSGPARDLEQVSIEGSVDDMLRVMDAAGVEKATLIGFSMGCQIILEAWRHAPDRISAIVPILGPYERPFDTAFPRGVGRIAFELFKRTGSRLGGLALKSASLTSQHPVSYTIAKLAGLVGKNVRYRDMEPFFEHLAEIDGPTWAALGVAAQSHSARDVLPTIEVPTLIVTGGKDSFAPPRLGQKMQRLVPDSELLVVPKAGHTGLLGHNEVIEEEVEHFLERHGLITDE